LKTGVTVHHSNNSLFLNRIARHHIAKHGVEHVLSCDEEYLYWMFLWIRCTSGLPQRMIFCTNFDSKNWIGYFPTKNISFSWFSSIIRTLSFIMVNHWCVLFTRISSISVLHSFWVKKGGSTFFFMRGKKNKKHFEAFRGG
jgi:hypothetical protein